jgi:hypothetical protein
MRFGGILAVFCGLGWEVEELSWDVSAGNLVEWLDPHDLE